MEKKNTSKLIFTPNVGKKKKTCWSCKGNNTARYSKCSKHATELTKNAKNEVLKILQAKDITIRTNPEIFVQADANLLGTTPVHYKIKSSCQKLIIIAHIP